MNALEAIVRSLEDELKRRAAKAEYADLARELEEALGVAVPTVAVVRMVHRADVRAAGPRRERDRCPRGRTEVLESYEERDLRLGTLRMNSPLAVASQVRKRLDEAADKAGQNGGPRTCPVCLRRYAGGRADRVTCGDHCRDLARRVHAGDPTVEASLRMLFEPGLCAGCGEALWAKRPDARHHDAKCVKRRQRLEYAAREKEPSIWPQRFSRNLHDARARDAVDAASQRAYARGDQSKWGRAALTADPVARREKSLRATATLPQRSERGSLAQADPLGVTRRRENPVSITADTAADHDAFIASAPTIGEAIERLEAAVAAGADVGGLLAAQAKRQRENA